MSERARKEVSEWVSASARVGLAAWITASPTAPHPNTATLAPLSTCAHVICMINNTVENKVVQRDVI